ncbi:MAG: alpha/beta hydrolase [Chitinophagales bacterium]
MKKVFRHKSTWMIILVLVLAAPLIYGYAMMSSFIWSDKEITEYFKNKISPSFKTYMVNGRSVFYASAGNDTLPMVLFIHGAPGSWYDFIEYFGDSNLISQTHLVAPDRPGYGRSGEGDFITSIEAQSNMIEPLLHLNKSKQPLMLVAHSYGGPIAVKLATDHPDRIKCMLLIAPQIDPGNEKQFAIDKLADVEVLQRMMPKMWLAAYHEKKTHIDELKKMDEAWEKISIPVIYMHGLEDQIVSPENARFAKLKFTNAPMDMITFPNENHFIPWTRQDSVTRIILSNTRE